MDKKDPQLDKADTSPELPSKHMEDARQDALVNTVPEDEIDNKIAEETGKGQPLPEDIEEVNHLKDSEVAHIANDAARAVATEPNPPIHGFAESKNGKLQSSRGQHTTLTAVLLILVCGVLAAVVFMVMR